jgi:hypothetical protein
MCPKCYFLYNPRHAGQTLRAVHRCVDTPNTQQGQIRPFTAVYERVDILLQNTHIDLFWRMFGLFHCAKIKYMLIL